MRSLRVLPLVCFALIVLLVLPATAETVTPPPPSWQQVQALPPQTLIQVKTDHSKISCLVTAVTDDKLTCSQSVFSRTEIKTIKLPRKAKSTLGGLLIGAGVGAGIGSAINAGDTGSLLHVSGAKSAGVGAAVGAIIGTGVGALVGHSTDLFATTIYKR